MWAGNWFVATARVRFWTWIWPIRHYRLCHEVACWFQCWENSTCFRLIGIITLILLMWKWMGLFLKKNHGLRCRDSIFLLNWIVGLTLYLLREKCPDSEFFLVRIQENKDQRKLRIRTLFTQCLLLKVPPFFDLRLLFISINVTYGPAWNTVFMCGCSWLLLGYVRYATETGLQDCWFFIRCFSWTLGSSELAELVPFPHSHGMSTRYSNRLHDFPIAIPRCYGDAYVNSSFPRWARLQYSLPANASLLFMI